MADWITPYCMDQYQILSIGQAPSQGIVYAINDQVVIKLPFQYLVPERLDPDLESFRDDSLRSLELLQKEAEIYAKVALHPHPKIVRCFFAQPESCLFLERVIHPLQLAQAEATKELRLRWIRQLLGAIVKLEELGYIHGDLAIQNLAVDSNDCLKLFDFGSATSKSDDTFNHTLRNDHSGLATCLYFLLSGIDLLAGAKNWGDVRCIQSEISSGRYGIAPEATILKNVILDGWTGVSALQNFSMTREIVEGVIGAGDNSVLPTARDLCAMRTRCTEWLNAATVELSWIAEKEYREQWRHLDYGLKNNALTEEKEDEAQSLVTRSNFIQSES